jgi:hypothetical protein
MYNMVIWFYLYVYVYVYVTFRCRWDIVLIYSIWFYIWLLYSHIYSVNHLYNVQTII